MVANQVSRGLGSRGQSLIMSMLSFGLLVVVWQAVVLLWAPPAFILPGPLAVLDRTLAFGTHWIPHVATTGWESLAGFLLSIVCGGLLAVLMTLFRPIERLLSPLVVGFQIAPKVALAPIFLVWFGLGAWSKILIAFMVAFFPIVVALRSGFASTEKEFLELARALRMSRLQELRYILIPASMPHLFAGLRVSSTLAVIGAVIGEFVSSQAGLGYVITVANNQLDTALALASIVLLSAFGFLLYGAVLLGEHWIVRWRPSGELSGSLFSW